MASQLEYHIEVYLTYCMIQQRKMKNEYIATYQAVSKLTKMHLQTCRYKYISSPLGRVVLSRFPHHASSSHEARGFPIDDIMTRTRTSCSNISQELHLTTHFGFRKLLQYFSCNPHHLDTAEPHAAETFPNPA